MLPFGGNLDERALEPLINHLQKVVGFAKTAGRITWAEKTRPLWESLYPSLSGGKPGLIGALTARAEAYTTRLACMYALLDESTEIQPEHLQAAVAIWEYAENSVRYIFRGMTRDRVASEIEETLRLRSEGMTRTEISNHFNRHKSAERIEAALKLLQENKRAKKLTKTTEGRSKEVWVINDKLTAN
ncbi:MAG: hypothetical protein ACHQ6U_09565 [Thermodesulfobacteriota bacterium]